MHWTRRGLLWSFHILLFGVPLIFLPNTSELFEFNKMILAYILTVFILFFWTSRMASENRFIFKKTLLDIPILIFLAVQLLSLLFSIDLRTSLLGYYSRFNGGLASLVCYAILYWASVSNLESKNVKSLLNTTLVSLLLVSAWGFLERLGIDASWWIQDVQNRVFSTLGQPNWLAAYLVILIFIPLAHYLKSKNIWSFALFTFTFLVLLFTRSRSGLLAFGISSVVFWSTYVFNLKTKKLSNLLVIGNWALVIIISLIIIPNPIKDLLIKAPAPELKAGSGTSLETGGTQSSEIRKIVWTGALRIWQASAKNFWLGTGPETFAMAYYQHRPIEHNNTSEWELLYNKAHNEFLNYLATTGLLGLCSYLVLLSVMLISLIKSNSLTTDNWSLKTTFLVGWLTIPITNFWGFSVVIVQILMFLLPAFAIILSQNSPQPSPDSFKTNSAANLIIIILSILSVFTFISIGRYWLADTLYAKGDNDYQSFTVTNEPLYLLSAYKNYSLAYEASPHEPVIISQLAFSSAYMSFLTAEKDATTASGLALYAKSLADKAISLNPLHPNLYKTASKAMIVLSITDKKYLYEADKYLQSAQRISPTDPRIPYNRGIIYRQLNLPDQALVQFRNSLALKPDFSDALVALKDFASASAGLK